MVVLNHQKSRKKLMERDVFLTTCTLMDKLICKNVRRHLPQMTSQNSYTWKLCSNIWIFLAKKQNKELLEQCVCTSTLI